MNGFTRGCVVAAITLGGCVQGTIGDEPERIEEAFGALSECGRNPKCSVGRPAARLEAGATGILPDVLTSTGRRNLTETEVNGLKKAWLSGCKGSFCNLYWLVQGEGDTKYGRYANVPRSAIQVRLEKNGPFLPAIEHGVRRLGGPSVEGEGVERYLVAGNELAAIWHPTHDGGGEAPLTGYSCVTDTNGACAYVTAADAPPNTAAGGKGYVSGIYKSGKKFFMLNRTAEVEVFRRIAPNQGPRGKAEWVYGYVKTPHGRVYMWVIRNVVIDEGNGQTSTYPGYVRKAALATASAEPDETEPGSDDAAPGACGLSELPYLAGNYACGDCMTQYCCAPGFACGQDAGCTAAANCSLACLVGTPECPAGGFDVCVGMPGYVGWESLIQCALASCPAECGG